MSDRVVQPATNAATLLVISIKQPLAGTCQVHMHPPLGLHIYTQYTLKYGATRTHITFLVCTIKIINTPKQPYNLEKTRITFKFTTGVKTTSSL